MRGALEEISVKSLRDERPDLPGFVRPSRGLSPINAGVAQGIERRIANPMVAGSIPAPGTNFRFHGCPVLSAPSSRNRQTREGHADYTRVG